MGQFQANSNTYLIMIRSAAPVNLMKECARCRALEAEILRIYAR